MSNRLLEVKNVRKVFGGGIGRQHETIAVDDFSLTLYDDDPKITAIAGESGSGKTTLARLILDFIKPTSGEILWRGRNLHKMSKRELMSYRHECQAVFQDPYAAFNPFYRVDHVFHMAVTEFKLARRKADEARIIGEALEVVGLRPQEILGKYPHQLSGGQRQRLIVARAFLLKPRLIVADEPVSMIDASLRAMILDIMLRLKDDFGIGFLYITHDLSTAYQISDRIFILYEGTVSETGDATEVIGNPQHPYTQLLIGSVPTPDPTRKWSEDIEVSAEEELGKGDKAGCKFVSRCPHAMEECHRSPPRLYEVGEDGHYASCYLYKGTD